MAKEKAQAQAQAQAQASQEVREPETDAPIANPDAPIANPDAPLPTPEPADAPLGDPAPQVEEPIAPAAAAPVSTRPTCPQCHSTDVGMAQGQRYCHGCQNIW